MSIIGKNPFEGAERKLSNAFSKMRKQTQAIFHKKTVTKATEPATKEAQRSVKSTAPETRHSHIVQKIANPPIPPSAPLPKKSKPLAERPEKQENVPVTKKAPRALPKSPEQIKKEQEYRAQLKAQVETDYAKTMREANKAYKKEKQEYEGDTQSLPRISRQSISVHKKEKLKEEKSKNIDTKTIQAYFSEKYTEIQTCIMELQELQKNPGNISLETIKHYINELNNLPDFTSKQTTHADYQESIQRHKAVLSEISKDMLTQSKVSELNNLIAEFNDTFSEFGLGIEVNLNRSQFK